MHPRAASLLSLLALAGCAKGEMLPSPTKPLVATARRDFPEAPAIPPLTQEVALPKIDGLVLANGLHVYVVAAPDAAEVEIRYIGRDGGENDRPLDMLGLSWLLTRSLEVTANDADDHGKLDAQKPIRVSAGREAAIVWTSAPADALDAVLAQLSSLLSLPSLSAKAIETAVAEQLDALHWSVHAQHDLAREHALRMLVGDEHPAAFPLIGRHENIARFTVADLEDRRIEAFSPASSALVVVGNVDQATVHRLVTQHFGRLPSTKVVPSRSASARAAEKKSPMRARALLTPGRVAHITQVFHAPPLEHPHHAAVALLSIITGELASARLWTAMREQQERTYGIGSRYAVRRGLSMLMIETQVDPDAVGDALFGIDAELERLRTELVTPVELARAKMQARKRMAAALEDSEDLAHTLTALSIEPSALSADPPALLRGHLARIEATTPEEIREAASTYLKRDARGVAIAGPLDHFLPSLADWAGQNVDLFVPKKFKRYYD